VKRAIDINPKFKDASFIRTQNEPPISDIFKDIPTTFRLTEIKILRFDYHDNFDFDWDNLSQILVQPQFSTLQRVSVIIKSRYSTFCYFMKDDVLEQMSDLHERGILDIIDNH
jgi:hypothetical protein